MIGVVRDLFSLKTERNQHACVHGITQQYNADFMVKAT